MRMDKAPTSDAYLDAVVEKTLAPYRALVSPDVLEVMRELLVESLVEDEVGRDLLERARPKKEPLQSGEQPMGGAEGAARKAGGEDG